MRTIIPVGARLLPPSAKQVFAGQIYNVHQWQQKLYDGSEATFEMLSRPDTIQVMGIKDHQLVVLKEQQPGLDQAFYGLPGGRHDVAGETELDAAKREMLEETGMSFSTWKLIDVIQPHTKIEWFVYLYVATGFTGQAPQHLDPGEKIDVELAGLERARTLAAGRSRDLPRELLEQVKTIDELANLPEYKGQA